jgi:CheY-like chemotaxis protein
MSAQVRAAYGANHRAGSGPRATILVVEDDRAICEMVAQVLEEEGYRVVTAADGFEAVKRLDEAHPDLVISDVMIPVLDGGHLASFIHARPARKPVPVVGMTALSRLRRATDSHFAVVLHKPFDVEQMVRTVARLLRNSASHT